MTALTMHAMSVGSFVPMLSSLSGILEKAEAHVGDDGAGLMGARLAEDMFPLSKQVQIACDHSLDCVARLTGQASSRGLNDETTLAQLRARIAETVARLQAADPADFAGAEERACVIPLPGNMEAAMTGLELLRGWSLPNIYFHIVTAYDILRHAGVPIGKRDYLAAMGQFMRPRAG